MYARNTRTVRSATLVGYAEAARSVGLDPDAMMARVGLEPASMDDPETVISLDAFQRLLSDSARLSGCPDFGTRASIYRSVPNFGAVTLLMREAETVEQAINFYTSHLALHADGPLVQLDKRFRNPLVVVEISARTRDESFQTTQFAIVGVTLLIRWLIGEEFQPEMISLAFPKVPNMRTQQNFFRCPVQYQQVVSGLVLSPAVLQRTPVTSSPFVRKLALQQLNPILNLSPNGFSTKVQRVIRLMLDEGSCDAQAVANHFNIDRRTLNRRLTLEGETFSSVLQSVRTEIVCRALGGSTCPLALIADEAGFECLSSFSRWFQKSFGCSASQWRAQQAAGKGNRAAAYSADSTGGRNTGLSNGF